MEPIRPKRDDSLSAGIARVVLQRNQPPPQPPREPDRFAERKRQVTEYRNQWRNAANTELGQALVSLGSEFAQKAAKAGVPKASIKVRTDIVVKSKPRDILGTSEKEIYTRKPGWVIQKSQREKRKWIRDTDPDHTPPDFKRETVAAAVLEVAVLTDGTIVDDHVPYFDQHTPPPLDGPPESVVREYRALMAGFLVDRGVRN